MAPDVDYSQLAAMMDGYSGDDVANVCRDAAMNGMRQAIAGKTPEQIRCAAQTACEAPCTCVSPGMHACVLVMIWPTLWTKCAHAAGCSCIRRRDKLLAIAYPGFPK